MNIDILYTYRDGLDLELEIPTKLTRSPLRQLYSTTVLYNLNILHSL